MLLGPLANRQLIGISEDINPFGEGQMMTAVFAMMSE